MREGLGFFYASRDMLDAKKSAAKAAKFGASWSAVLVESVDGRRQKTERIVDACEALRAVDVAPLLYTFPDPSKAAEAAERAAKAAEAARVVDVIVDAEPFGGHDWTRGSLEGVHATLSGRGLVVAWTTFYRRRWGAVRFPPGPMLLQVYERVRDPEELARAVALFPGREIVPCIGSHTDDGRVAIDAKAAGAVNARALGVWALATTSDAEGEALLAWATRPR